MVLIKQFGRDININCLNQFLFFEVIKKMFVAINKMILKKLLDHYNNFLDYFTNFLDYFKHSKLVEDNQY